MEKCIFGGHVHAPLTVEHHHHDHHREHEHHDHDHSHDYRSVDKKVLGVALVITFSTMILEIVFGLIAGSLALVSDAIHMFTHSFALGISYFAIILANKQAPAAKTFGYHRMEVLAAFLNAVTIGLSVVWILYEAFERFINPQPMEAGISIIVAVIGLTVNVITGVILMKGDITNINLRSAFLHMMADTLSSVAIVIGITVIYFTGWVIIDPLIALVVAFVIAKWSYSLFKGSVNVLLEASPVNVEEIEQFISDAHEHIYDVHDLHVCEVTHRMYCLTAHIIIKSEGEESYNKIIKKLTDGLRAEYNIGHVTFQPEWV
ncbi:MAG: cation transporter [Denitrovibrio sp.]|nr:MAG: cation transporter [Denitrovibrio sp.]